MKRREFLYGLGGAGVLSAAGLPALAMPGSVASRGVLVAVDHDAPEPIRAAGQSICAAQNHPLLTAFGKQSNAKPVSSKALLSAPLEERAYNHLVLVGLMDDVLIRTAWQREARQKAAGFYVFGFGTMRGDIGYIESDRNLFLHSQQIAVAPFETQVVTITGNTPAGVSLACDAFLTHHLVNGVVGGPGWTRGETGLLDRDPLSPSFTVPELAPLEIKGARRIGLTQASEDEYRGVLADTGLKPASIWRAKYFVPGAWDRANGNAAFDAYSNGLHRRAYGSTRWIAQFGSDADASLAAGKIAGAAQLPRKGDRWEGSLPYYGNKESLGNQTPGPLVLHQQGSAVVMSSVVND